MLFVRHLVVLMRFLVTVVMILKAAGGVIPVCQQQVRMTVLLSVQLPAQRMRYPVIMVGLTIVGVATIACLPRMEYASLSALLTAVMMRSGVIWAPALMVASWGTIALPRGAKGIVTPSVPCPAPMMRSHVTMIWAPMAVGWATTALIK